LNSLLNTLFIIVLVLVCVRIYNKTVILNIVRFVVSNVVCDIVHCHD